MEKFPGNYKEWKFWKCSYISKFLHFKQINVCEVHKLQKHNKSFDLKNCLHEFVIYSVYAWIIIEKKFRICNIIDRV